MRRYAQCLSVLVVIVAIFASITTRSHANANAWHVTEAGTLLEISYGSGTNFPQYAVLHREKGGTSAWKTNAPTIEIGLDGSRPITGWVTSSSNPDDDNIGFWAASDDILRSYHYTITSSKPVTNSYLLWTK